MALKLSRLFMFPCLLAVVVLVADLMNNHGTTNSAAVLERSAAVRARSRDRPTGSARLVCQQNPYAGALLEGGGLEEVGRRMDAWLRDLGRHHEKAIGGSMFEHTHDRFFPFDAAMASCSGRLSCVGGACGKDASKIVCGLEELVPRNATSHVQQGDGNAPRTCIVYSIGGNNEWQFELDILRKTPCEVHTFDCTGPIERFDKQPKNEPRLHFHHVCLGTRHEGAPPRCVGKQKCGETWTLLEMQTKLRHVRIDLFKMDIEGYEWPLLESWPELGDGHAATVSLPMQILVEVHYRTQFAELRPPGVGAGRDYRFARDVVNLQAHLLRMGYAVVERDDNRLCRHCTELTLLRVRCPPPAAAPPSAAVPSVRRESSVNLGENVTDHVTAHNFVQIAASETTEKLHAMGLEPLYDSQFDISDPWKAELYRRLDRIRVACGAMCQINSVEALERYSVAVESQHLPMVVVPNVDCPAILGLEEIDAADLTAPAIPDELLDYFTLHKAYNVSGHRRRRDFYLGGESEKSLWKTGNIWNEDDIEQLVKEIARGTVKGSYGVESTNYVRDKLSEIDMKGKSVLVIGSSHPWVEAICLHYGAAKVTTLEYGKIVSHHPRLCTLTPEEFRAKFLANELEEFDGVVSHSSLEHSGLGRYGDALNPWGDILAVARAWCVTKTGGFLYLGLPTGKDRIMSNWHRVYGRLRWPLITANWRRIDQTDGAELQRGIWKAQENGGWGCIFRKEDPLVVSSTNEE